MLEEKGKGSPGSRGILPAGAGTCSCPALALQGVWDQGIAPRGAPIPCANTEELEESPAEQGWVEGKVKTPPGPPGCFPPLPAAPAPAEHSHGGTKGPHPSSDGQIED